MVRRRRSTRRKPYKVVKYSNETISFASSLPVANPPSPLNEYATIITPLNAQGMRKAKNFTLQIISTCPLPITFALVYVPQGTEPNALTFGTVDKPISLYEPNQNVIISGTVIANSPQQTWRTRLARNLNSGDGIALVLGTPVNLTTSGDVSITLNYAITSEFI